MAYDQQIPTRQQDLSGWYNKTILAAELADYGAAKGTMIFRPYGFAIWEKIQQWLDAEFKQHQVQNAYFPLFIPETLLQQEQTHIKGFSPELAVVTIGGGEELSERLVVRPTSEVLVGQAFAKWIQSYRDLPMQINQWNNVVRWEKRTYLFLRTTEFLWQEGHTAHASHQAAIETQQWAIILYQRFFQEVLALPGHVGYKSEAERFAGALTTMTYEALMPDGKALQSATSHDLGQNFAKSFKIHYQDKTGKRQTVWQTSWGLSTRVIGGLLLAHGDDKGLRLPPAVAPIQVIIIPVRVEKNVLSYCQSILSNLSDMLRIELDTNDEETLGFKISKWEQKGVPIRLEIGAREEQAQTVTLVRRDSGEKQVVKQDAAASTINSLLKEIQQNLRQEAEYFLSSNTHVISSYQEFKQLMSSSRGFIQAFWCEDAACETKIKEETKATTRCRVADQPKNAGTCIYCGKTASQQWYFAQSY